MRDCADSEVEDVIEEPCIELALEEVTFSDGKHGCRVDAGATKYLGCQMQAGGLPPTYSAISLEVIALSVG